ncbi:hypothetical protein B0T21DRAFT_188171 [Apiosordaria backusii]|uniref:Uncharacterized protein n=1 Tax=Apiosordaria backusii TaxID=314023 RepID=A0AA40BJS9_9PEZI|nr:hypothetical protein B0T21DRAFT_188171 [Apiosordaria backusii]
MGWCFMILEVACEMAWGMDGMNNPYETAEWDKQGSHIRSLCGLRRCWMRSDIVVRDHCDREDLRSPVSLIKADFCSEIGTIEKDFDGSPRAVPSQRMGKETQQPNKPRETCGSCVVFDEWGF